MENSENFAQLFEESSTRQETRSGEIITAEVVAIDRNHVVLNANLKSDALLPREEFVNIQGELEVSVGDFVKVVIEQLEDGFGNTKLSRQKAKVQEAWVFLEKALEEGITVTGKVLNRVRGGLSVLVNGVKAFLPGSLVDVRLLKDTTDLEGQILDFKVVKIDRKRTNVVLSRKAVLEENSITDKAKAAEILQEGALVSGVVKAITDYGAFVEFNDVKGINGLIHITDLSWKRVRHPSEIISVEQAITAKVLRYDEERNRVSLGLKQLSEDPWIGIARRYPAGTRMFGKVTNITDYGAFVEIETGIEGLVHVTEMEWSNKNIVPSKLVTVGQEVEVMVLEIDEDRRRISLGMKQCKANPWEEFELNHKKGDKVKGVIKSITDFGLFLGLPGNIDGLVHLTDLSWTQPGEEALKTYKKGDEVEAVVMNVDVAKERISLSIRQLESDPYSEFVTSHEKNSIVKGTVKAVEAKFATIALEGSDNEGILKASEFSRERVNDLTQKLKEGDVIEAMITNIDNKNRAIYLSIRAKEQAEQTAAMQKFAADSNEAASAGTTNLGALLKAKLDETKE